MEYGLTANHYTIWVAQKSFYKVERTFLQLFQ